ncbi:TPA: GIY-YIG nuclease family protein [Stenotrophomonas maltophilia]|nr:GIY-YIG nuclease family protein [Stenotrophomonas maltophilia]
MIYLDRDDVRSLTADDLHEGRWLTAEGCAIYLGLFPHKGTAIVRRKTFPAPGSSDSDGQPLWDVAAISDWAAQHVRQEAKSQATCLYRHFNAAGDLLYVGISISIMQRTRTHGYAAAWFRDVSRITVAWHPTRAEAEKAERVAIREEKPRFNKAHTK